MGRCWHPEHHGANRKAQHDATVFGKSCDLAPLATRVIVSFHPWMSKFDARDVFLVVNARLPTDWQPSFLEVQKLIRPGLVADRRADNVEPQVVSLPKRA
jgi:hypothetical protein